MASTSPRVGRGLTGEALARGRVGRVVGGFGCCDGCVKIGFPGGPEIEIPGERWLSGLQHFVEAIAGFFRGGGGCSGFQYQLAFDEPRQDDSIFEDHGLKLLVDSQALEYVDGSQIDYVDALTGAGFQVENPNVVAACGCGSSFRVADQESCSPV